MPSAPKTPKPAKNPWVQSLRLTGALAARVGAKRLRKFDFKRGVNILCGPNGCGKTTVLNALFPRKKDGGIGLDMDPSQWGFDPKRIKVEGTRHGMIRRFDFEKNNPRMSGHNAFMMGNMSMWALGRNLEMKSHGEAQKYLLDGLLKVVDSVLLLDEPEQALDLDGMQTLKMMLGHLQRCQIVIATHSPALILDPAYNVVELVPGYRKKVREMLTRLVQP